MLYTPTQKDNAKEPPLANVYETENGKFFFTFLYNVYVDTVLAKKEDLQYI